MEDAEGNVILDNTQETHEALSPHAAWYMVYMLRYAVLYGTGTAAQISGVPVAGKTGTTTSNRDRWFSGFTPKYTASVWCGFDDPEEVRLVVNQNPAVIMWKSVMSKLMDGLSKEEIGEFVQPDDERFVSVQVCSQTGLLAGAKCTPKTVYLFSSDVPEDTCEEHLEFEIQLCYPNGRSGKSYCANADCVSYNKLVTSAEFKALCILFPELKRFQENPLEKKTIYILRNQKKDDDGKEKEEPTLEDALEENEIDLCTYHNHEKLVELQNAIREAMQAVQPEPSEPEEPEPSEAP